MDENQEMLLTPDEEAPQEVAQEAAHEPEPEPAPERPALRRGRLYALPRPRRNLGDTMSTYSRFLLLLGFALVGLASILACAAYFWPDTPPGRRERVAEFVEGNAVDAIAR